MAAIMVILVLPFGNFASAEEPEENDAALLWETEAYEGGVAVTKYNGTETDVFVPATFTVNGVEKAVIKLGNGLFEDNDTVNSVSLASGITEIGDRAFYDVDALICIIANEQLASIGDEAFYGCDNFNSVILPDSLTSIGVNAFENCPKLTVWCNQDSYAYEYATANGIACEIINPSTSPETVEIDGITYYVQNGAAIAIDCADDVTSVVIPATVNGYPVTELRETFREHKNIVSVTLPETITKIGAYSFYFTTLLSEINIPKSVIEISENSFTGCYKLSEVILPEGLKTIGNSAFSYCKSLSSIEIPKNVVSLGTSAFSNCEQLSIVTIPDNITSLPNDVFNNCANLLRVTLPETLTSIGSNAFYVCDSLVCIVIPRSVTSMRTNSFSAFTLLAVYEDSYAHTFAEANDIPYAIYDGINLPGMHVANGITYVIKNEEAIAVDCDEN